MKIAGEIPESTPKTSPFILISPSKCFEKKNANKNYLIYNGNASIDSKGKQSSKER